MERDERDNDPAGWQAVNSMSLQSYSPMTETQTAHRLSGFLLFSLVAVLCLVVRRLRVSTYCTHGAMPGMDGWLAVNGI